MSQRKSDRNLKNISSRTKGSKSDSYNSLRSVSKRRKNRARVKSEVYSPIKKFISNKKTVSRLILSGAVVLSVLALFFIISLATRKNASEVFVDGSKVCVVNNRAITGEYISKTVGLLISNEYGANISINEKITAVPVRAKKSDMLTEDASILLVRGKVTYKVEGAAFIVDGAVVTVLSNMDEAVRLKTDIMNEYIPEGSEIVIDECSFLENVSIENRYFDQSEIKTYDEALLRLTEGSKGQKPYTIVSGDTLSKIAQKNSTTVENILSLNPDMNINTVLRIGQKLNVESYTPFLSVKTVENTSYIEKQPKETEYQYDKTRPASYKKVIKQGKDGQRRVNVQIIRINGFEEETKTVSLETIEEPINEIILVGTN